jgi:ketosteroid isomerase-like protein
MSAENVDVVRRLYEAVARGDAPTVLSLYDPEVEWDASRSPLGRVTGASVFRGHEGLRRAFREWYEGWEHVEDEVEKLLDAGEQVIAVVTLRGRGRSSGVEVEWKSYAAAWTIREGKVVRVVWFPSREEALEAVGLRNG